MVVCLLGAASSDTISEVNLDILWYTILLVPHIIIM